MRATPRITQAQHDALAAARVLAESGVPVFLGSPSAAEPTGYKVPRGWQHTKPDPSIVDRWRPGMALCAVMGHGLDAVDVDPRGGGESSLADLRARGILPRTYAEADTPSGGKHFLVASIGVRSRDGLLPGIDLKAGAVGPDGDATAAGCGFVFIAPTVRVSKTTGEPTPYRWVTPPGVDTRTVCLVGGDDSGGALRELVTAKRPEPPSPASEAYDSPTYADLSPSQQEVADRAVAAKVAEWRNRLDEAQGWPEGKRDEHGRGWESLARDAAWAMAGLAAATWTGVTVEAARDFYAQILPEAIANDPRCGGKWSDRLVDKIGTDQVDAPPWADFSPLAEDPDDLWSATPMLAHVRQAAHARLISAPALLAYVLGRVLAELPAEVVLPPVVGSPASLNLGLAVVGRSGDGKSALLRTSRDVLGLNVIGQEDIERNVGSGEGLAQSFLRLIKDGNVLIDDPRRIFLVDEIDSLGAKQSRQGATLGADMRTMLTGGVLGQANAERNRNRHVPTGVYRAIVFAGVQPTRSGTLLRDTDAGTPQRFLWVRATDRSMRQGVTYPGPLAWALPSELPREVDYPDAVKEEVRRARYRQATGGGDPTEGHRLLTQLKVATGLAFLHGDTAITHEWWQLAGVLVAESMVIQQECRRELDDAAADASRARGRQAAIEQGSAKATQDQMVEADAKRIAREIHSHATGAENAWLKHGRDVGCTPGCANRGLRHSRSKLREEGLARALAEGWVVEHNGRWHPGSAVPEK